MIIAITPENRLQHTETLERMYAMRDRVVRNQLRWKVPGTVIGNDREVFDTQNAVYFVLLRGDQVLACMRLLRTTAPHMMSEVFSHCLEAGHSVRGPETLELSRYLLDMEAPNYRIGLPILEYALTFACNNAGIKSIIWLSHMKAFKHACGTWKTKLLGLPTHFPDDDCEYVAAQSDLSGDALERVVKRYDLDPMTCRSIERQARHAIKALDPRTSRTEAA